MAKKIAKEVLNTYSKTMSEITPDLTVGDIIRSGQYGEFADYIFTDMTPDHWNNQLSAYGYETTGIEKALHRMQELASDGEEYIHYIYGDEERMANWDKKKVCLLHFPGPVKNRPYVLIIPGGALNRQWGLIEGQAIAAKINELGYSAFVLFYRTKQEPVMDKSLEDMYKAIRYIEAKAGYFHVISGRYILGGFSAGAILAQEIGTKNLGWQQQGVPKPEMVFLGYTACLFKEWYQMWKTLKNSDPAKEDSAVFLRKMGGPQFTLESLEPYQIQEYIDESYPPVYLVCNRDDKIVGVESTLCLDQCFAEMQVPHITRIGRVGGHSFGLGNGLEVEGWLEEAIRFWNDITSSKG